MRREEPDSIREGVPSDGRMGCTYVAVIPCGRNGADRPARELDVACWDVAPWGCGNDMPLQPR